APQVLDLPDPLLDLLSAGAPNPRDRPTEVEVFGDTRTPGFRLEVAAAAAADLALQDLLEPSRLNRVLEQGEREAGQLGLPELLDATIRAVFADDGGGAHAGTVRRAVRARLVTHLAGAVSARSLSPGAAAVLHAALADLGRRLAAVRRGSPEDLAQARYYAALLAAPTSEHLAVLVGREAGQPAPPPGMPIGAAEDDWFGDGGG
ncbi:MAG: peptidase, partial [Proteobacteria bacterium]|nr:peptidase [Pseudomonadota bacterium]